MNVDASLLGLYRPGGGWLFRVSIGWKYLLMLVLTLPPLILLWWPLTVGFNVVTLACLVSSGIDVRRAVRIGWFMWCLLGTLAAYHLITLNPAAAVIQPGNILVAVFAARLLTLSTPTPELLDALQRALQPLRFVGVSPLRVALTIALMIRSIPYLIGLFDDARDAARARGAERNVVAHLLPVVLGAVAYSERTGEALIARGLGEQHSG